MSYYKHHVFFCLNQRDGGQDCCAVHGAQAGFDLQLSGHTHAGQFFPWTLAVRLGHAPHVTGLSKQDRMWVYVSAGTGTWGPPVRLGTRPELTLVRLVAARNIAMGAALFEVAAELFASTLVTMIHPLKSTRGPFHLAP